MEPDKAQSYRPDPAYLHELVGRIGRSQREIARRLGVNEGQFRKYLTAKERPSHRPAPYLLQWALECWANCSADPPKE